jgi:hypothetical protein
LLPVGVGGWREPLDARLALKRFTIATLVLAAALLAGPVVGAATAACSAPAKATAYDDPIDENSSTVIRSDSWFAQPFTVSYDTTLTTVSLYLEQLGSVTDPIDVDVRSAAGGKPDALLGTRRRTLTNTGYEFADFDFSADHIALAAGQTYYLLLRSADSEGYQVGSDYAHPHHNYPGTTFYSADAGSSWQASTAGEDALFRVFGQTCTADVPPPVPPQPQVPAAVSQLAFSSSTFAAEARGASADSANSARGSKVSFTLNQPATVRFTVTQRTKGHKVKRGKKTACVKPTRKNRTGKRCTRTVTLKGSFTRDGVLGANSFHFTGRLRGRKLKPGRYRLVSTPSVGGTKGVPTSAGFRIVR